jgi:hypothetical protein
MSKVKININLIYILFCSTLIFLSLIGHFNGTLLYDSKIQIIIINILFILAVINTSNNNIFLKFFLFYFFIFYIFNIYSFSLVGYDPIFIEKKQDILEVNHSLSILILHFITLYFLINYFFKDSFQSLKNFKLDKPEIVSLIYACLIFMLFEFLIMFLIQKNIVNFSLIKILAVLFSIDKTLIVISSISIIFWDKITTYLKFICSSIIFFSIYSDFMNGSKSSLFFVMLIVFICIFRIKGKIELNLKQILLIFFSTIIALLLYYYSSKTNTLVAVNFVDIKNFILSFFNRIGFLDFFLEKNNGYIYKELFTIEYNLKAFLDKITPGFDPYGIPLIKNQFHFLLNNDGLYYSGVVSEQSTVFALYNRIFGELYFIFYFLILFLFNKFYFQFNFISNTKKIIIQILVLIIFYEFLNGFGVDQILMISLYYIIFIYSLFLTSNLLKTLISK